MATSSLRCLSHTPTIGYASIKTTNRSGLAPIFEHTRRTTLAARKATRRRVYIFNVRHVVFFDHYSPFALGIGLRIRRPMKARPAGTAALIGTRSSRAYRQRAVARVRPLVLQDKALDHGAFSPPPSCGHTSGMACADRAAASRRRTFPIHRRSELQLAKRCGGD